MRIDGCTRRMILGALWSLQHVCLSCSSQMSCFCSQDKEDSSTAAIRVFPPIPTVDPSAYKLPTGHPVSSLGGFSVSPRLGIIYRNVFLISLRASRSAAWPSHNFFLG
jgi:hypothetical protein